ncbi:MAG: lytic transglycosylase domain-containing protein [Pedobacter sp.]|nr:lytic transglycosylase domain-containing protein [Chitinophagaceae bacterium]
MSPITCYRSVFIFLLFANSNFAQTKTDTSTTDKIGFKSLFANNQFNPNKPYLSQLSPKAVPFVQEYIRKQGKELTKMKEWGRPYFSLYDNILTQYGVPKEMKYLSVIESHLRSGLVSWAGAVGPWQLMDYEAKRFGLRVGTIDDRMDYTKSTQVAAKLMKELYAQFGDWLLVVAAYNGGAGRVRQAIRKSGSKDFWDLQYFLKEETRTHVKKFIGTHYLFEGSGGLTTMTKQEASDFKANEATKNTTITLTEEEQNSTTIITLKGRYNSRIVIKFLDMDLVQFTKWNPAFDRTLSIGDSYNLRLQKDKIAIFEAKKNEILSESIRWLLEGK